MDKWRDQALILTDNRDACELDLSPQDARNEKIVEPNETFIGRRVISRNIQREFPSYLAYLNGSRRHVAISCTHEKQPTLDLVSAIENEFTELFRTGNWLEDHLQTLHSFSLHGRGIFMVIPEKDPNENLGTRAQYVAAEDFVFAVGARKLQKSPLIGVKFRISSDQFLEWKRAYGWNAEAETEYNNTPVQDRPTKMFEVYLMFCRKIDEQPKGDETKPQQPAASGIHVFWYYHDRTKLFTQPQPFTSGKYGPDGQPVPSDLYPFFPVYYRITENPKLVERKGRAHEDSHDQEAATMMWTGLVNGCIRASEIYPSVDQTPTTENAEVKQTEEVLTPGRISTKPLRFHNMPWPDSMMITALQALTSENASSAGQVDFAAQARKDSRKTAKELSLAEDQSSQNKSVPLTMFSAGYKSLLTYQFEILRANCAANVNTTFLADNLAARQAFIDYQWTVIPAGDTDFVERNEQLKLYMSIYPMVQGTAVGLYFLRKILELAFPKDYKQLEPLLQDNSKQMLAALIAVMRELPMDNVPPELQQKVGEIIKAASESLGPQEGGQNAAAPSPTESAPAA